MFAFYSDLRNELRWNPRARSVEKLTDGPLTVGALAVQHRIPVVDGLHLFVQVHLDPPSMVIRIGPSVPKRSPVPKLAESSRKAATWLSVVSQDDHAGRIRIRTLQADLLDPHTVVVVGLKPPLTGEPSLEPLLQTSLEGAWIRRRLRHLGLRRRLIVHVGMVRSMESRTSVARRPPASVLHGDALLTKRVIEMSLADAAVVFLRLCLDQQSPSTIRGDLVGPHPGAGHPSRVVVGLVRGEVGRRDEPNASAHPPSSRRRAISSV
jgi:hypothetical protein